MRSGADFLADDVAVIIGNREYFHDLIVFIGEESDRSAICSIPYAHLFASDLESARYPSVYELLYLAQLLGSHFRIVAEIESEPFGCDVRPLLIRFRAKHLMECRMEKMGCRVIFDGRSGSIGKAAFEFLFRRDFRDVLVLFGLPCVIFFIHLQSFRRGIFLHQLERDSIGGMQLEYDVS